MVSPEFEKALFEGLQSLEATLKAAKDEMQTDCRGAAITSLQGVVEFINSIPRFESLNLSCPLTAVMAALHDLNVGRVGAMVTPTAGFDNRKPEASFRKVIKAYAIFGVEQLKDAGMTTEEACKFVASELARIMHHAGPFLRVVPTVARRRSVRLDRCLSTRRTTRLGWSAFSAARRGTAPRLMDRTA